MMDDAKSTRRTLTCLSCSATATLDCSAGESRISVMAAASDYYPLMMNDTSVSWLCAGCADRIIPHVRALLDLLHDPGVYWNGLKYLADDREIRRRARESIDRGGSKC